MPALTDMTPCVEKVEPEFSQGLLMVAPYFPPRNAAGVFRSLRFARYLPDLGWDVHVLTIDPKSYEIGTRLDEGLMKKVPSHVHVHLAPAIYPINWVTGLKRWLRPGSNHRSGGSEPSNQCMPGTPPAASTYWQRTKDALTDRLTTPDRYVGWIRYAVRSGERIIRQNNIRGIYSSAPPFSTHVVGYRLKKATGLPWVADCRDPWIDADFKPRYQGNTWQGRQQRQFERQMVESSDRVVVNTIRAKDKFLARHADIPEDKFVVLPNGYDSADYDGLLESHDTSTSRKLVFMHAGTFYGKRSVIGFIDALANLIARGDIARNQVEVRLIGALRNDRDLELHHVKQLDLQDVIHVLPPIAHAECLRGLATADVLLLVQIGAHDSIPGKVFEYLALRKPVFTLADDGATRDMALNERLGPCVSPDDITSIEAAILRTYREHSTGEGVTACSAEVRERYDGRRLSQKLSDILVQAQLDCAASQSAGDPA